MNMADFYFLVFTGFLFTLGIFVLGVVFGFEFGKRTRNYEYNTEILEMRRMRDRAENENKILKNKLKAMEE